MSAIEGRVLVTGGTGALGGAVVEGLLASGAGVAATWIVEAERDAVSARLGDRDGLELLRADLSTEEGAREAVEAAAPDGALAALVCLVGGFAAPGRLHEADLGELERMVDLNLMTAARAARAALPGMVAAGSGAIVCVGAKAALEPSSGAAGYAVSKGAVLTLVRALDAEYRSDGVRVNAILPSVIDTPANREAMPDADTSLWVPPAEISRVVAFLCSPDSAPISGAWVPVYGRGG